MRRRRWTISITLESRQGNVRVSFWSPGDLLRVEITLREKVVIQRGLMIRDSLEVGLSAIHTVNLAVDDPLCGFIKLGIIVLVEELLFPEIVSCPSYHLLIILPSHRQHLFRFDPIVLRALPVERVH